MVAEAAFEGAIPAEGVEDLLGGLEEIGTTGVLAFQSTSGSGAIRLVHGQVADAETTADEERALEALLSLRDGEFAVSDPGAGPDRVRLNVGGGVVYDSTAASEYEEALWKARFTNLSPMG